MTRARRVLAYIRETERQGPRLCLENADALMQHARRGMALFPAGDEPAATVINAELARARELIRLAETDA